MCAGFDRAFAAVIDLAAPEDVWPFSSVAFEFEPGIVGIHGSAGKEVADFLVRTTTSTRTSSPRRTRRAHTIERRGDRCGCFEFSTTGSDFILGFFPHRESCGKVCCCG